jgi:hypothetical protein
MVDTAKAEKAFLLGFKRLSNEYAKMLQFIDVHPVYGDGTPTPSSFSDRSKITGFRFDGKVGIGADTCTIGFQTSELITCNFNYMNRITNDVYTGVKFYFDMPDHERMAGRSGLTHQDMTELLEDDDLFDRPRTLSHKIMDNLTNADLFDKRKDRA